MAIYIYTYTGNEWANKTEEKKQDFREGGGRSEKSKRKLFEVDFRKSDSRNLQEIGITSLHNFRYPKQSKNKWEENFLVNQ